MPAPLPSMGCACNAVRRVLVLCVCCALVLQARTSGPHMQTAQHTYKNYTSNLFGKYLRNRLPVARCRADSSSSSLWHAEQAKRRATGAQLLQSLRTLRANKGTKRKADQVGRWPSLAHAPRMLTPRLSHQEPLLQHVTLLHPPKVPPTWARFADELQHNNKHAISTVLSDQQHQVPSFWNPAGDCCVLQQPSQHCIHICTRRGEMHAH
jgi:hypothetical protein